MTPTALPENWTPAPRGYKHVVSVSIGSSKRNAREELSVLGQNFVLERIGTDGDMDKAAQLFRELDGKIDAFGLGGTDLYIVAGDKKYSFKDIAKLCQNATQTPILDGSGLKHTLEREAVRILDKHIQWRGKRTLMVAAVDRFGMAEALSEAGADVFYGDVVFSLGLPVPLRSIGSLRTVANMLLPIITHLPFKWFYPTGDKQDKEVTGAGSKYYHWADVIAGDFLYIRRYAPKNLQGKIILTNTTTPDDMQWAKDAGVKELITTTPRIGGRSFGTNVMEAFFVALAGEKKTLSPEAYLSYIQQIGFKPEINALQSIP